MWHEIYQDVGATAGMFAGLAVMIRMSSNGRMAVVLASLLCILFTLDLDRDVSREQAVLTSRMVDDPACTAVDVTMDGDSVEKWLVACPKRPGRPL